MDQFFVAIFDVRPAVVLAPDVQRVHPPGPVGDPRLKAMARNLPQRLAARLGTLLDAQANHNPSPARLVQCHCLHFQAGDLGLLPMGLILPAEALHLLRQPRHKMSLKNL